MQWDDPIFEGTLGQWRWIVVRKPITELRAFILTHHAGQRLCITAFDSGPLKPDSEMRHIGWTSVGDVAVSPPLIPQLWIPFGEYDEWYVFPIAPNSIEVKHRYVNIGGFTLAEPQQMAASRDPTWCHAIYDWLVPIQADFWSDMERLKPSSYVSTSDDADIVVTRDLAFFRQVRDAATLSVDGR